MFPFDVQITKVTTGSQLDFSVLQLFLGVPNRMCHSCLQTSCWNHTGPPGPFSSALAPPGLLPAGPLGKLQYCRCPSWNQNWWCQVHSLSQCCQVSQPLSCQSRMTFPEQAGKMASSLQFCALHCDLGSEWAVLWTENHKHFLWIVFPVSDFHLSKPWGLKPSSKI